jgi:hypothetical protein
MGERRRGDDAIIKAWAAMIVTVKIMLKTKDAEAPGVQCCCCGAAARREPKPLGIRQPTRAVAPWSPRTLCGGTPGTARPSSRGSRWAGSGARVHAANDHAGEFLGCLYDNGRGDCSMIWAPWHCPSPFVRASEGSSSEVQ